MRPRYNKSSLFIAVTEACSGAAVLQLTGHETLDSCHGSVYPVMACVLTYVRLKAHTVRETWRGATSDTTNAVRQKFIYSVTDMWAVHSSVTNTEQHLNAHINLSAGEEPWWKLCLHRHGGVMVREGHRQQLRGDLQRFGLIPANVLGLQNPDRVIHLQVQIKKREQSWEGHEWLLFSSLCRENLDQCNEVTPSTPTAWLFTTSNIPSVH